MIFVRLHTESSHMSQYEGDRENMRPRSVCVRVYVCVSVRDSIYVIIIIFCVLLLISYLTHPNCVCMLFGAAPLFMP